MTVELDGHGTPLTVSTDRRTGGSPDRVIETDPSADPPIRRSVASIGEVWRVDDEWWRTPLHRRYIDVILQGGKHVILYQDELTGDWFEQTP